jgi:formamidopyrimidine-DNA glycosylase
MPELPEVELVSRSLNKLIKDRKIVNCELLREKLVPHNSAFEFESFLAETSISFVNRRGKNILINLDNSRTLLVHLRMSGRFMLLPPERENPKHTHAIFNFADGLRLVFQDNRHFGFMRILETASLNESSELAKLAPEPFSKEFSKEYFLRTLSTSKQSLKKILLDQNKICGLGNIYACEAMFAAKINPEILANLITKKAALRLFDAIKSVLNLAIDHGQKAEIDPENIDGSYFGGDDVNPWNVYDQEGKKCQVCDSIIERIAQFGRSTYFCVKCQKI